MNKVKPILNRQRPPPSRRKRGELLEILKLNHAIKDVPATPAQLKILHATIKKVTEDLDGMRFNTAISAMMVFVNEAMTWETKPVSALRDFLILLAPFAPHVAEELWAKLNSSFVIRHSSLSYAAWPNFDASLLIEDTLEIPVQVNGKLRDVIKVPTNADNATLEAAAVGVRKKRSRLWMAKPSEKSSSSRKNSSTLWSDNEANPLNACSHAELKNHQLRGHAKSRKGAGVLCGNARPEINQ